MLRMEVFIDIYAYERFVWDCRWDIGYFSFKLFAQLYLGRQGNAARLLVMPMDVILIVDHLAKLPRCSMMSKISLWPWIQYS